MSLRTSSNWLFFAIMFDVYEHSHFVLVLRQRRCHRNNKCWKSPLGPAVIVLFFFPATKIGCGACAATRHQKPVAKTKKYIIICHLCRSPRRRMSITHESWQKTIKAEEGKKAKRNEWGGERAASTCVNYSYKSSLEWKVHKATLTTPNGRTRICCRLVGHEKCHEREKHARNKKVMNRKLFGLGSWRREPRAGRYGETIMMGWWHISQHLLCDNSSPCRLRMWIVKFVHRLNLIHK